MKNLLKIRTTKSNAWFIGAAMSALTIVSCTTESTDLEDQGTLESTNQSFVTPVSGRIYTIQNRRSGRFMDIENRSNSNGANLQQFGTSANSSATHRQWEVINVGSGFVRLRGVDSRKSLEVRNGSNSNGANVEQRAYDNRTHQEWEIIPTNNGYFRIRSRDSRKSMAVRGGSRSNGANIEIDNWNGANRFQWFFREVGNSGGSSGGGTTTPSNPTNNGGGDAEDIIGGRRNWKLNGFSGNLRVGNNDNGLDYADDASLNESHFFFEQNGAAVFRCWPGNPTSGGSSNPRSETREQIDGGDGFWDGTTNTERSMKWRFSVDDLPPSGKLCFGQIHERDDRFDDIIRVQVEGDEGQNSGDVTLRILGYVTEELEGSGRSINFDMRMDTEYYFELTMRNSVVRLYNLNNSGNRIRTLYTSDNVGNADQNYFKAGCYLQSTRSSHADSNVYGQVSIRDISVSPND